MSVDPEDFEGQSVLILGRGILVLYITDICWWMVVMMMVIIVVMMLGDDDGDDDGDDSGGDGR